MEELKYKDLFTQLFSSLWKIILLTGIHIVHAIKITSKFLVGLVRAYPQIALIMFITITIVLVTFNFMNVRFSRSTLEHTQFEYETKLEYMDSVNKMNLELIKSLRDSLHGAKVQADYYKTMKTYTVKHVNKTDTVK